jgi:hypothetical protein
LDFRRASNRAELEDALAWAFAFAERPAGARLLEIMTDGQSDYDMHRLVRSRVATALAGRDFFKQPAGRPHNS